MVAWLVGTGLRLGKLVVAAAAAVLVLGVPLVAGAPVETYPEFTPTTVEVQTESLGLSATEIELSPAMAKLAEPRNQGSMLAAKPSSVSERLKPRVPGPTSPPTGSGIPVIA